MTLDDLTAMGVRLLAEHIGMGCDCNVSVVVPTAATGVSDADVIHETRCRILDIADRMS